MDANTNYDTFHVKRPFLVVADARTGGTYLCCCLDSHPDIGCYRDEPLHPDSKWLELIGKKNALKLAYVIWNRMGYKVSGLKVTYPEYDMFLDGKIDLSITKCIHLARNPLGVMLSRVIAIWRDGDPRYSHHTYTSVDPNPVEINPGWFVKECLAIQEETERYKAKLYDQFGDNYLYLEYEHIIPERVGGDICSGWMPKAVSDMLCNFLDVGYWSMYSSTRPVNASRAGCARSVRPSVGRSPG